MSQVQQFLSTATRIEREADDEYLAAVKTAQDKRTLRMAEVAGIRAAAQEICGHEYVTTVNWTEDGAFPNEPRSRIDCSICNKQGVM